MDKKQIAWHFLNDKCMTRKSNDNAGEILITVGQKLTVPENLVIPCESGLHASKRPLDALYYCPTDTKYVQLVELSGKIVEHGDDKLCASERKCLWLFDCEKLLHEFSCWCAEQTIYLFEKEFPDDDRPRKAIQAKRDFINGKITANELAAAWSAAWSAELAARSAAESAAGSAAWSAARSAAWSAGLAAESAARSAGLAAESAESAAWSAGLAAESAESAAWSAAWSAGSAAWSAAWSAQNDELESMLLLELPGELVAIYESRY